jgi:hypothetical protein
MLRAVRVQTVKVVGLGPMGIVVLLLALMHPPLPVLGVSKLVNGRINVGRCVPECLTQLSVLFSA